MKLFLTNGYLSSKLLLSLLFLFCLECNADTNDSVDQRKPVSLTVRVPEAGVYAVSITDKDIIMQDTLQPNIVNTMLDNSALLNDIKKTTPLKHNFETEQIISGRVKRAFLKVKNPQIIVLNPRTGERQDYSLDHHQSFNLLGFDIQEGGSLVLQATKENGRDNLVELVIKEPYFPQLSMSKLQKDSIHFSLSQVKKEQLTLSATKKEEAAAKEIELDEVVVQGKKYKPLNFFRHIPYKCLNYKDDILAKSNSMVAVCIRLGLLVHNDSIGLYKLVYAGFSGMIVFVSPKIYIDDFESESREVLNLSPNDIKQIEYFSADQEETRFTLHPTQSGALCIYTKGNRPRRNTLSMKAVQPLGYRPSKVPYNPLNDTTYVSSSDHRVMLYWNPALVVDSTCKAQITFMPSSTSSNYNVSLMGIGNTGEIASNTNGKADSTPLSEEQEKSVADYLDNTPREKVYIQTDRSLYCAGDTVWFRVHVADALSNIPTTSSLYPADRSKFVYTELHHNSKFNEKGKKTDDTLVERIMIKQDSLGVFSSYIVLPSKPVSNNYTLVAYTRHMLNFSEEQFFYKQIQVVN